MIFDSYPPLVVQCNTLDTIAYSRFSFLLFCLCTLGISFLQVMSKTLLSSWYLDLDKQHKTVAIMQGFLLP